MKRKGKALLSLLLVMTLAVQLFAVSASAEGMVSGWESLVRAIYLRDEFGQSQMLSAENEYLLEGKAYSVSVSGQALDASPNGATLGQLLSGDLSITPPDGWYIDQVWLYGDDPGTVNALPLTASSSSAAVSVVSDAFIQRYDYGTPVFDEGRISSFSGSQCYTVGVRFAQIDPAAGAAITYSDGSYAGEGYAQTGGAPYDDPNGVFAGWRLQYANGASVLVPAYSEVRTYAPATLTAVYAPKITLKPADLTLPEGADLYAAQASLQQEVYNLPGDLALLDVQFSIDAGNPLAAGSYPTHVTGYRLVESWTGKPVDSSRGVVVTQDGVLTIEASQQPPQPTEEIITVEPDPVPIVTNIAYSAVSGDGQQWVRGSGDLSIQFNAEMSKLTGVQVDGWGIDGSCYGLGYDSLTLLSGYLQTLGAGSHSLALSFTDGSASASFSVAEPAAAVYEFTSGQGQVWVRGYTGDLGFGVNANLNAFTSLDVDGVTLGEGTYGVDAASSLVGVSTLHLQTLAAGEHTLTVHLTDGYASTSFTVAEPAVYDFYAGSNQQWIRGFSTDPSFQLSADLSKLSSVEFGGILLDPAYYTIYSDPASFSLSGGYLSQLGAGAYTLVFRFLDGYAETTLTVAEPSAYSFSSGAGQSFTLGSETDIGFGISSDPAKLQSLTVDGAVLDSYYYGINTELVGVSALYLNTLAEGEHSLSLTYTDGTASTTFVVTRPEPVSYAVTSGNGQQWIRGYSADPVFGLEADLNKFSAAELDGSVLGSEAAAVDAANGTVTVYASALQTLSAGEHSLVFRFTDGSASASFTVAEPAVYRVVSGDGQKWVRGFGSDPVFGLEGDLNSLNFAELDGSALGSDAAAVDAANGTVTVYGSALESLSAGEHSLVFRFTDGNASASFTVAEPTVYPVVSGDGQKWVRGFGGDASFGIDADLTGRGAVVLDGATLSEDSFSVDTAAGTVSLGSALLEPLSAGDHNLIIRFADGFAAAGFTVAEPTGYSFLSGDGQKWVRGFGGDASFRLDADLSKLAAVRLDGAALSAESYALDTENAALSLKTAALQELSAGEHSLSLAFTDGSATASFTVAEPTVYHFVSGENQTWVRNAESMSIKPDADVSTLREVQVDGATLDAANTWTDDGSVVISKDYLQTLAAGEYSISFAFGDGYATTGFTVAEPEPTALNVTVNDQGWTSDGTARELDQNAYRIDGLAEGDQAAVSLTAAKADGQSVGTAVSEPGSYRILASVSGFDTAKYKLGEITEGTLTVTAPEIKVVTVTVKDQTLAYTGAGLAIDPKAYTVEGLDQGDELPVTLSLLDRTGNKVSTVTDVGAYNIQAGVGSYDARKYSVTIANTGKLTVTPYELTVTAVPVNFTYDGSAHTSTQVNATLLPGHRFLEPGGVTAAIYDSNNLLQAGGAVAAGTYTIHVTAVRIIDANGNEVTANYKTTFVDGTLTITTATDTRVPLTINVQDQTWAADGSAHSIDGTKYTVAGLPNGVTVHVTLSAVNASGQPIGTTPAIGTYRIVATHDADANKYNVTVVPGTLTVTSPVNYSSLDTTPRRWTKGSTEGLSFRINGDLSRYAGKVEVDNTQLPENYYSVMSGSTLVTLNPAYLNTLNEGTHGLRVSFVDGSFSSTFTVEKAAGLALTVTGYNVNKAYDGQPYNMSTYGQNSYGIIGSYHLAQNGQTVSQAVAAGVYDIYLDSLRASDTRNTYVFTVKDANGNVLTNNYQNTPLRIGTLTITNTALTPVTVTVKDQSWTYDGAAHTLSVTNENAGNYYTITGLQSGDAINVRLSILDLSGRALSSVTDVGSYNIKAEVTGYNTGKYTVTVANQGTLKITPYKLTLTAVSATKAYDGSTTFDKKSNVSATALLPGHSFRSGDGVKFSIYDSRGNLIQSGPVNVGVYTKKVTEVHIVDSGNREVTSNYDITRIDGTLTITASGSNSPRTGDTNNILLWVVLLAASAVLIAIVAFVLLRRRKAAKPGKATEPEIGPDNPEDFDPDLGGSGGKTSTRKR